MDETMWRTTSNVPGLIRLVCAYCAQHKAFPAVLQQHLDTVLQRFQFVLSHRRLESYAFVLLNALFRHVPAQVYSAKFQQLVQVLLTRLQTKKTPKMMKDFALAMSIFVNISGDHTLPNTLNQIQPGLTQNILLHVWLPSCKTVKPSDEKKVMALALARLMTHPEIAGNAQHFQACLEALAALIGPGALEEKEEEKEKLLDAGQEYEVAFSKLSSTETAQSRLPDPGDVLQQAKQLLAPHKPTIAQVVQMAGPANPALNQLGAIFVA